MDKKEILSILCFLTAILMKGGMSAFCSDDYDRRALNMTQCLYKTAMKIRDGYTPCHTAEWSVICTFVPTGSCSRLIEAHKYASRMTGQMYPDLLETCLILVPSTGVMVIPTDYTKPDCSNYKARLAGMTDCLRQMAENIYKGERICSVMPEAASCWWKLAQDCPLLKQVFHNLTRLVDILYDVQARDCAVTVSDLMVMVPVDFQLDVLVVCPRTQRCAAPIMDMLGTALDVDGNIPQQAMETVRVLPVLWRQALMGDTSLLQTMCKWNAMLDTTWIAGCLAKEYFTCTGEFVLSTVKHPPGGQMSNKNALFTEAVTTSIASSRPGVGARFTEIMDMMCRQGCSNIEDRKDSLLKCTLAAQMHTLNLNINSSSDLDALLGEFCGAMQVIASCLSEVANGCPAMGIVVDYGIESMRILPEAAKYCQLNFQTLGVGNAGPSQFPPGKSKEFNAVDGGEVPQYIPNENDVNVYLRDGAQPLAPSAVILYTIFLSSWLALF